MGFFVLVVQILPVLFGFAGGGGSDSGFDSGGFDSGGFDFGGSDYGSGSGGFIDGWVILIVIVGIVIVIIDESRKSKSGVQPTSDEAMKMAAMMTEVDHNDTPEETDLHKKAKTVFETYQKDWSDNNTAAVAKYTTDSYGKHARLMMLALEKMGRRNVVSELKIQKVSLLTPIDSGTALPTKVTVCFKFDGVDDLVDVKTGEKLHHDKVYGAFEVWNFIYDGTNLMLDSITQPTESVSHKVKSIEEFATESEMFYSLDWGRLALPTSGVIFNKTVLTSADVNNHLIGEWGNCLVQIYTYSERPSYPNSYYLVGQINVPKLYEGVIIEAKRAHLKVQKPAHYTQFEMEWEDFNKRYNVFASNKDALVAFELLNPAFMEQLYNQNLPYNIEVKDNSIYLFANVGFAKKEDYVELMDVLIKAYHELKM